MALTWREIEERLEEAALTLKRLPNPRGSGARGYGSSWPEVVREARHAYGYEEARMRVIPSAAEISRYEEAVGWLAFVSDPMDRRILWMRASGWPVRAVARQVGLTKSSVQRHYMAGLLTIAKHLTRKGKPAVKMDESGAKVDETSPKAANIGRDKTAGAAYT